MFQSNLSIGVFLAAVAAGNWLAVNHLVPQPSTEIVAEEVEDNWTLPAIELGNSAIVTHSKLSKFQAWGAINKKEVVAEETEKKPQKPTYAWKLVAIVGTGSHQYILAINGKTQKVEQYRQKDELPDGSRLLEIHPNQVSIEKETEEGTDIQQVKLHQPPKG